MKSLEAPLFDVSSLGFALRMLQSLGVGLSLKPDGRMIRGVNIEKGGLVYQDEDDIIDLDVKEAIILLKLYYLPYNEHGIYEIDTLKAIKIFIQKYYQYHLQTTLKNLK